MKKISLRNAIAVLAVIAAVQSGFAQTNYVHQVVILNEGWFDYGNDTQMVQVTIGAYEPATQNYSVFDVIPNARFGSDVVIDSNFIYVAADTLLLVYDKYTLLQVNSRVVHGIRKLNVWNNHILVSRGDMMPFNSYFQVYDKSTLNLVYELDTVNGPKYASEGIAVLNDTAYIAINNAYEWPPNLVGILGIIDLSAQSYKDEVDFGPNGINPDNVMIDGTNIYTLNNKDFTGSSITSYDAVTRTPATVNVAISSGCGTSVKAANLIYYQEYGLDKLARFDVNTQGIVDTLNNSVAYYGLLTDELNNIIYATATDYETYGMAYIMDYNAVVSDSFAVGVSPANMALDIRTSTGLDEVSSATSLKVYPNPANSSVSIEFNGEEEVENITITDVLGRMVFSKQIGSSFRNMKLDISGLPNGLYLLSVETVNARMLSRLIKQ